MDQVSSNKLRAKINFALLTFGFFWLWTFNRNPHVLTKYFSHQGYVLTWLYFLLVITDCQKVFNYSRVRLFELCLVLQVLISLIYWSVIHGPSVSSGKLSSKSSLYLASNMWWNVYIHSLPLILLVCELFFTRQRLGNHWKDSIYFFLFVALPINIRNPGFI